jgi:hypothetical protein
MKVLSILLLGVLLAAACNDKPPMVPDPDVTAEAGAG